MFNVFPLQKLLSRFSSLFPQLFSAKSLFSAILFASLFSFSPLSTFADSFTDIQEAVVGVAVLVVHFVVYITWVVIGMMGDLLGNDAVMHPNVIPILKLLWTMMRNFINMAAVFWLLYIAFKTLFTSFSGVDTGEIGKNLGKLAMALVVVNFSWLAVVVIIDASSVATHYSFLLSDVVKGGTTFNGLCKSDSSGTENCMQSVYSIKYNTEVTAKGQSNVDANTNGLKAKTDIANAIFKVPYTKDLISSTGDVDINKFEANKEKIANANGITLANTANFKCWTKDAGQGSYSSNSSEALDQLIAASKSTTQTNTSSSDITTGSTCSPAAFLKYRYQTAAIVLVLKPLTADMGDISNRTLVAMIAQNILPLEEFLTRAKSAGSVGTVFLQIFTSLALSIMMLIAFIALAAVLFVRVAILWLALLASPLIALLIIDDDAFGLKEHFFKVIHLAFVPAYFGVVFSLTFVILGQMSYNGSSVIGFSGGKPIILENGIMQTGTPMFNLMLSILVLVLFWMAVFWALKQAPIAGKIAGFIDEKVRTGAKFLAERPLYMNIIPMGTRADGSAIMGDLKSVEKSLNKVFSNDGHLNDLEQMRETMVKDKDAVKQIQNANNVKSDIKLDIAFDKLDLTNKEHFNKFETAITQSGKFDAVTRLQGKEKASALLQIANTLGNKQMGSEQFNRTVNAISGSTSSRTESTLEKGINDKFKAISKFSPAKGAELASVLQTKAGVDPDKFDSKVTQDGFIGMLTGLDPKFTGGNIDDVIQWLKTNGDNNKNKTAIKKYLETGS